MDINQLELSRETIFKDAVLSQAEARSMEIIAEAGKKRADALEQAYQQCERADYDIIKNHMTFENEKEFTAVSGQARRELLRHREALVEEMFGEVEKRLAAFTETPGYDAWLAARLEKHRDMQGTLTVYLRPGDMGKSGAVQKALPGAEVQPDESILLGGCKLSDGRVLFDETLDEALQLQKQAFFSSGALRLDTPREPDDTQGKTGQETQ